MAGEKTQDNFYGQGRLRNKGESNCQSPPLGTASLPHEMETKQRLTVVHCKNRLVVLTTEWLRWLHVLVW